MCYVLWRVRGREEGNVAVSLVSALVDVRAPTIPLKSMAFFSDLQVVLSGCCCVSLNKSWTCCKCAHVSSPQIENGTTACYLSDKRLPRDHQASDERRLIRRDSRQRGTERNKRANRYKVAVHGRTIESMEFAKTLDLNSELSTSLPELSGMRLVCHCLPSNRATQTL